MRLMLVTVQWETDGEPAPPETVNVPEPLRYLPTDRWDPVSEYLSNKYGYLVQDWKVIE